jgi:hypothetical protein
MNTGMLDRHEMTFAIRIVAAAWHYLRIIIITVVFICSVYLDIDKFIACIQSTRCDDARSSPALLLVIHSGALVVPLSYRGNWL